MLTETDLAALQHSGLPPPVVRLRLELEEPPVWTGDGPPVAGLPVHARGLSKTLGGRRVLDGLDLDIAAGTFVAVIGRSGCGKSTLLRLLGGLEAPDPVPETLPTHVHADVPPQPAPGLSGRSSADVRTMFQDARLLPWKRVLDNVALGLPPGHPRSAARAALQAVGLADRADDWPAVLSGGQRQRVALARALVHRPRLLLLDEPLGALDALTRLEMHGLIERLWREHRFTAVLVTHDVAEAVSLADRVLLIEAGRIAYAATIDLPRPRRRGDPAVAAHERALLDRLMQPGTGSADAR